jgi:anti-anti-sigma regulatory factor
MIAIKTSKSTGVEFSLANVSPEIMKILEMTMLSSHLKIIQE